MDLALSNVINISVSQAGAGVGEYNTSNLGLFTQEVPGVGFGSLGYKLYVSPTEVGTDFGTSSETFKQANAIFSQQPNILANGGYLAVIPFVPATQHLAFSGIAASGSFELNFAADVTPAINWNDTLPTIQTKVRTLTGLEAAVVTGSIATSLNVEFEGYYGPAALLTVTNDTLQTSAPAAITILVTTATAGETFDAAIVRTEGLVQYFGLFGARIFSQADMLAAAAVVEPLNKIALFVSRDDLDVLPGGMLDLLRTGGFDKSRGLYYGGNDDDSALVMMAAYAGRAFSTNFEGSNTTQTMHLKDLNGVQPDPSMTQTLLDQCQLAGADVYVSIQGVAKVFCSGANDFFDNVYNLQWFIGALQVAGFNVLAQTSTKIPQTEAGVSVLKGGYRQVCEQAVTNQFAAPGVWNSPDTFGNQSDLLQNVAQRGYYIYSIPISQQSPAVRATRAAPLIQIALKYAGAIHSSFVIVNVNP